METMRWSEQDTSHRVGSPDAPTIKNHSVTHFNGYLYCFGGYDGQQNHQTLLLYSIHEQRWIQPHHVGETDQPPFTGATSVIVSGIRPPGRNGHSATLAIDPDDDDHARIIIIGGWLGMGPLAAADMHVLDISHGGRQLRWSRPAVKGTPPGPCNMHSADYVSARKEVYVFRGGNGREYLNDLHALSVDTLSWRKVETSGCAPQERANHSSAILEETGELFIFGGWNGTERLNDIHILDTATSTWTCPHVGGVLPHPRAGMTLTAFRGRLYLFGGSGTSSKCFQDLQILDRSEMAWLDVTQVEPTNHVHRHASYRPHDKVDHGRPRWKFGGYDGVQSGSTGESANASSMDICQGGGAAGTHSARSDWRSREMAVRPRNTAMVVSPNPNDEDTVPTVLVKGCGPGRRAGHTATAVNRKIFVFGGSCGSDYLNDFYVLDTDPPLNAVVTEPTSLHLVERRLSHFFNDEEFSDVTFIVQGRKVYGHKMVLSLVSDCFRAMFMAGFRESASMEVEIPDCSYDAFVAVLEYIYCGTNPRANAEQAAISHTVEILELADRFFLDHLKQVCETLLQQAINTETVDYFYQVAQKTNSMQLQAICEHYLRNRETQWDGPT